MPALTSLLKSLAVLGTLAVSAQAGEQCRCFPGDPCWPTADEWRRFNQTIDGRLVATVPIASPCHTPGYDEAQCATLKDEWRWPQVQYVGGLHPSPVQLPQLTQCSLESSSSIMAPYFTNGSCHPFSPVEKPCTLGNLIVYAVDVSRPEHISKALDFANKHNIRVVVRNTGHDYNGKSTGAGALGIWTHHLQSIDFPDWEDSHYSGKAIKMGAGVMGIDAYRAADAQGLHVVGGECPTVGLAGGYSQGGGHSALMSRYGLAADQVLEWEVVDGKGRFLTANRQQNSDLYWALSGGGGSTYGVVYSMTSKAHPSTPVSGFNLTFTNRGVSQDAFYKAVALYNENLPPMVDAGAMSVWYFTDASFTVAPVTAPDVPEDKLVALVQPFLDSLKKLGIQYTFHSQQFPNYLAQYDAMQAPIQVGIAQYGGWLIPRSAVENNNDALTAAYRNITESGAQFIGVGANVSRAVAGDVHNAVLPAWRDTLIDTVITTPWSYEAPTSEMVELQHKMTNDYIPKLEAVAPDSGAYMNEVCRR